MASPHSKALKIKMIFFVVSLPFCVYLHLQSLIQSRSSDVFYAAFWDCGLQNHLIHSPLGLLSFFYFNALSTPFCALPHPFF
jgi:hypothetical protein